MKQYFLYSVHTPHLPHSSQWLSSLTQRLADLRVFGDNAPNHVLVNEYTPGQGIMVSGMTPPGHHGESDDTIMT